MSKKSSKKKIPAQPDPPPPVPPPIQPNPPGPMITNLRILGGALIEVPCYESHRQGRNWMAKVQPNANAPGGWERAFAKQGRGDDMIYIVQDIFPGDVLEFGADYTTSVGRKYPKRRYAYVVARTEDALKVVLFDNIIEAWTAREYITLPPAPAEPFKPSDEVSPGILELKELTRKLQALLDDPQPGLFTWTKMVKDRCKEIGQFG